MPNWQKKPPPVRWNSKQERLYEEQLGAGAFEREIKFIVNGGEMDSAALRPWKQEVDHRGKRSNKLGSSDVSPP